MSSYILICWLLRFAYLSLTTGAYIAYFQSEYSKQMTSWPKNFPSLVQVNNFKKVFFVFIFVKTFELYTVVQSSRICAMMMNDLSIGSSETKYIKLNTKTHFFLNNIQLLYTLKKEKKNPSVFLSPMSKRIKKSSNFHLNDKKYFGF